MLEQVDAIYRILYTDKKQETDFYEYIQNAENRIKELGYKYNGHKINKETGRNKINYIKKYKNKVERAYLEAVPNENPSILPSDHIFLKEESE